MRPKYLFGEFELNPASRELLRNGQPVALRPRSLECLIYLIEHRDRAVGRDELISAVWGRVDASDTVVAQTLLRARKALDDTGNQQVMIRTLPRFGYRWVAPVREVSTPWDAGVEEAADAGAGVADALPSTLYAEADCETAANDDEGEAADVEELDVEVPDVDAFDVDEFDADQPMASETAGADGEPATIVAPAAAKRRRLPRIILLATLALVVALGVGVLL